MDEVYADTVEDVLRMVLRGGVTPDAAAGRLIQMGRTRKDALALVRMSVDGMLTKLRAFIAGQGPLRNAAWIAISSDGSEVTALWDLPDVYLEVGFVDGQPSYYARTADAEYLGDDMAIPEIVMSKLRCDCDKGATE